MRFCPICCRTSGRQAAARAADQHLRADADQHLRADDDAARRMVGEDGDLLQHLGEGVPDPHPHHSHGQRPMSGKSGCLGQQVMGHPVSRMP